MRILFTIGSYDSFGGTEKITTVLANAFADRGHAVCIAAFRGHCDPALLGLHADVKCFDLAKVALREVLVSQQTDVIINQWCLPFFVTRAINRARQGLKVRLISALHGVPDRSKRVIVAEEAVRTAHGIGKLAAWLKLQAIHAVIKASIRHVYARSDAYVVLSRGFVKSFQSYTRLHHTPKLVVIGNPITIPTVGRLPPVPRQRSLLYVGRMDRENKRVNRILEAWEQVAPLHPDWTLTLVGGGPHLDELKAYAADHRLARVTFTGFIREDPIRYYQAASIFVLTSDLEGFGLVLVEAMAHGVVPVVYGSYVSVFDIVDHGRNGLITPAPYSREATVAALCRLMDDPGELARMSAAAVAKSGQFGLDRVVGQWEDLFG